ncbi:MAG: transcriptional regulator [Cyclobacteriaceae bacterium]|nr:transcriptional regulator [Cyclobacteriaceae bacterium]
MVALKYTVIKSKRQYREYTRVLEDLVFTDFKGREMKDEIELLTLLIEKWDKENNTFEDVDPVALLRALLKEHNLKAKDLVEILGVSKGLVSDILNYKKGMSKGIIRTLSEYFRLSQEAFNRPYPLTD